MTDRQTLFVFENPFFALIFVGKLVEAMEDLAILRIDEAVIVIDGGEKDRREWIMSLSQISGAMKAVFGGGSRL